jgi:hypothetical protein
VRHLQQAEEGRLVPQGRPLQGQPVADLRGLPRREAEQRRGRRHPDPRRRRRPRPHDAARARLRGAADRRHRRRPDPRRRRPVLRDRQSTRGRLLREGRPRADRRTDEQAHAGERAHRPVEARPLRGAAAAQQQRPPRQRRAAGSRLAHELPRRQDLRRLEAARRRQAGAGEARPDPGKRRLPHAQRRTVARHLASERRDLRQRRDRPRLARREGARRAHPRRHLEPVRGRQDGPRPRDRRRRVGGRGRRHGSPLRPHRRHQRRRSHPTSRRTCGSCG